MLVKMKASMRRSNKFRKTAEVLQEIREKLDRPGTGIREQNEGKSNDWCEQRKSRRFRRQARSSR